MDTAKAKHRNTVEELEARKLAIKELARKKIEAAKTSRAKEMKALGRLERQVKAKDAVEKKKADNRSKILLGIVLIDLANHDASFKAKVEEYTRQFFVSSPSRLGSALKGLALAVTKPENDTWQEDL